MSKQQSGSLFALFFDPRVPVLFVLGSIVLAIVGNGVYQLLLIAVGDAPRTIVAIVIGALLIMGLITVGFRAVVGMLATRVIAPALPADQQAAPHAGLILFVSQGQNTAEEPAVRFHLKSSTLTHCWLIVSPEVQPKAAQLAAWLREQKIEPILLPLPDAFQAQLSYRVVDEALDQAERILGPGGAIVDITAGTKTMTAGAVLAARDRGAAMQYMRTTFVDGRPVVKSEPLAMKVEHA